MIEKNQATYFEFAEMRQTLAEHVGRIRGRIGGRFA